MQFAAMAVNEFLARIHKFRDDGNEEYAVTRFSLTQNQYYFEQEDDACQALSRHVGRGDVTPFC